MTAEIVLEQDSVTIYELLGSNDQKRIEALLEMYAALFPQYKQYIPRMRDRVKRPQKNERGHTVHYWLIEVGGEPAGLRIFRYIPTRQCGIAQALAVYPEYRKVTVDGQRLARFIIYSCLDQIIQDGNIPGTSPALGMVNEVESDRLMKHYIRNGLIKLPVCYKEPVFGSHEDGTDQIEFAHMSLGFLANPDLISIVYNEKTLKDFTMAFLVDHYGLAEDHPEVQLTLGSVSRQQKECRELAGGKNG